MDNCYCVIYLRWFYCKRVIRPAYYNNIRGSIEVNLRENVITSARKSSRYNCLYRWAAKALDHESNIDSSFAYMFFLSEDYVKLDTYDWGGGEGENGELAKNDHVYHDVWQDCKLLRSRYWIAALWLTFTPMLNPWNWSFGSSPVSRSTSSWVSVYKDKEHTGLPLRAVHRDFYAIHSLPEHPEGVETSRWKGRWTKDLQPTNNAKLCDDLNKPRYDKTD